MLADVRVGSFATFSAILLMPALLPKAEILSSALPEEWLCMTDTDTSRDADDTAKAGQGGKGARGHAPTLEAAMADFRRAWDSAESRVA
jgi:hypothetical protein